MFFSQRAENLAERGGGGQTADFSLCFERFRVAYPAQPLLGAALGLEDFSMFWVFGMKYRTGAS